MARIVLLSTVLVLVWFSAIEATVLPYPPPTAAPDVAKCAPTAKSTTTSAPTVKSTTPTKCAPTTTYPTTAVPTGTPPTKTVPTGTPPTRTVPTGTPPTRTVPTGTPPTRTVPTGTPPTKTVPTATQPTKTVPTVKTTDKTVPTKPTCGLNQVYSECGNNGCQNTCQNPQISLVCKAACVPGCICKEGYLRNSKNECVLPENCDCTRPNEVFSKCGNHGCQNTCEEPDLITRCTTIAGCFPGCICKTGFLRNKNGDCVPQKDCYKCKANEVFKDCGSFACENTCASPDLSTKCDPSQSCEPGCFCAPGFLRNENGLCVAKNQCPVKCTGVHEVFSECGNNSCQKNCDTYDLALACKPTCNPGCICEDGYIRNKKGVCVKPDECENRICTKKNEYYSLCVSPCAERCSNLGQDIVCNFLVCNPGCDCKPGFFRNSKNECVPPAECDCGVNEELDMCHNNCPPRTCDAIGKLFKCAVPDPNKCRPACKCVFDHRRNADGLCVPVQMCPPLTCSGENEEYNPCPASCLDQRCESLYDPLACPAVVTECAPQCVCRPGYLRNSAGKCIPKNQCPQFCADPNAIFNPCGNVCPITCANKDKPRICQETCIASGGCVCKTGYVQNYKGECILPKDCPSCGANEVFACGSACDTTCATLGDPCPIVNIKCNEKCYCIDGYARNAQNVCVPIKECPPKFTCPANQKYNACPMSCPPEETCEFHLSGAAYDCAPENDRICKPRCECLSGLLRRVEGGECIKPNQCCADPNAEIVSCPNPCPGGTCEAPKFADCKAPCKIRGCQCKEGYVKDSTGKCILLSQCPVKCTGQNEEWNSCGSACETTCENKDLKIACLDACKPGCFCKAGFVRKNGKCVRPEECACGEYETFVSCAPNVQTTCATLGKPVCKECKPGCVCIPGYVRDCHGGKCIKTTACSPY